MPLYALLGANILNLETVRSSTTTSLLKFTSLGSDVWFDTIVGVWVVDRGSVTKVANWLTSILGATKKNSVISLWCAEGELIEGKALSTSLGNAGSDRRKLKMNSKNSNTWHLQWIWGHRWSTWGPQGVWHRWWRFQQWQRSYLPFLSCNETSGKER